MHDLLQRMLKAPCFLDSTELADLRRLFSEGVQKSDVLVLLGTSGVLERPWCLLELHEADIHGIPVIFLPLAGRGFSIEGAKAFVASLEDELLRRNPGALAEIRQHLGGDSAIKKFKKRLIRKLDEAAACSELNRLRWESNGTDNALLACARELCDAMAAQAGLELTWEDTFKQKFDKSTSSIFLTDQNSTGDLSHVSEPTASSQISASEDTPSHRDSHARPKWVTFHRSRASSESVHHRTSERSSSPSKQTVPTSGPTFGCFLSYFREESGSEARLMQLELERRLGRPVYLDATDAEDLSTILSEGVGRSAGLVLLQSAHVLHRPWCLLELNEALRRCA